MRFFALNKWFFIWSLVGLVAARAALMAVMPLTDPSEARYGAIAANMAQMGDFLTPRFIYRGVWQSFDGKPPLFFQAGGAAVLLLGRNEFAVRAPSLLAALLLVGMVFHTARRLANGRVAACAALLCASNWTFFLFSGLCMTDMLLALCVGGAVCSYMLFAGCAEGERKMHSMWFFAFLALGMLAKGPVALVLGGMPVFVFVCAGRRWRELAGHAWVAGPALFLAVAAPWYAAMAARDPGFLEYFFINENFLRFVTPDYGDRYGAGRETFRGMALVWFFVASLPHLPFVIGIGVSGRGRGGGGSGAGGAGGAGGGSGGSGGSGAGWRRVFGEGCFSRNPLTALPLLGCLCMAGFWCLTSRALLPYLLPVAPLSALWSAAKLEEWGVLDAPRSRRFLMGSVAAAGAFVLVGLGLALFPGFGLSAKMPKRVYREALRIQRGAPEFADAKFYFSGSAPYSAEFYFGGALRSHAPELDAESVARSGGDFLLASKRSMKHILAAPTTATQTKPPRKAVFECREWTVFAPESAAPEAGL